MSSNAHDNSYLPQELKNKYAVSRTIGSGACGEVKLCFSKIGCHKFAIKIIKKSKISTSNYGSDDRHIFNEVEISKNLIHVLIIYFIF